jgi:hypothetical protein
MHWRLIYEIVGLRGIFGVNDQFEIVKMRRYGNHAQFYYGCFVGFVLD